MCNIFLFYPKLGQLLICLFILYCSIGCKNSEKQTQSDNNKISASKEVGVKTKAIEQLGEGVLCVTNENGERVLCKNKTPDGGWIFIVYQTSSLTSIHERFDPVQQVTWYDKDQLKITPKQGIPSRDNTKQDLLLNLISGKSIPVNKQF